MIRGVWELNLKNLWSVSSKTKWVYYNRLYCMCVCLAVTRPSWPIMQTRWKFWKALWRQCKMMCKAGKCICWHWSNSLIQSKESLQGPWNKLACPMTAIKCHSFTSYWKERTKKKLHHLSFVCPKLFGRSKVRLPRNQETKSWGFVKEGLLCTKRELGQSIV